MPRNETGLRHRWTLDAAQYFQTIARLRRETQGFEDDAEEATDEVEKGFDRAGRGLGRFTNLMTRARGTLNGWLAAIGVSGVLGGMFQMNRSLEITSTQFETLAGSAENATRLMQQLREFTATTPFQEAEVFGSARSLLAFGFDSDQLPETLRSLGNVAAGLKIPLGELAEIYGKIRVQNRLMQEDINQLQGRGINVTAEFARQFGVAESEVRALTETGQIGFRNLEIALKSLTSEGGIFAGQTENLAATADGILSTLGDIAKLGIQEAGAGFFALVKEDLESLLALLQSARESGQFGEVVNTVSDSLAGLYEVARRGAGLLVQHGATIGKLIALYVSWRASIVVLNTASSLYFATIRGGLSVINLFNAGINLGKSAVFALQGRTLAATITFRAFNTAIKANPIGLLVSLVATAVTALTLFRRETEETADSQRELAKEVERNISALDRQAGASVRSRQVEIETRLSRLRDGRTQATFRLIEAEARLRNLREEAGVSPTPQLQGQIFQAEQDRLELTRLINQTEQEIGIVSRESAAIGESLNRNLIQRLGYLEAIREELVAQGGAGEIAGRNLQQVREEISVLQVQIDNLRGSGGSPENFIPIDREAERRLQRFGQLLARASEEMRILEGATDDERKAIRALIAAEKELSNIQKVLEDQALDISDDQRREAERVESFLQAQVDRLRSEANALGEASKVALQAARALETVAPDLLSGAVDQTIGERLQIQIEEFENKVRELETLRAAGQISEGAFNAQVAKMAEEFRAKLIEVLNLLQSMGLVSDEAMEALLEGFNSANRHINQHQTKLREVTNQYRTLATAFRSVSSLARAFGLVDDSVLSLIDNMGELFDQIQKVSDAQTALANLQKQQAAGQSVSGIGNAQRASALAQFNLFAGLSSAMFSLAGVIRDSANKRREEARRAAEEMERLRSTLRDTANRFQASIQQLLGPITGQDVTGNQAREASSILAELEEERQRAQRGTGGRGRGGTLPQDDQAFRELLRRLEDTGISAFQGLEDLFDQIIAANGGNIVAAMNSLLQGIDDAASGIRFDGLESIIRRLEENLGGVADSVSGFLRAFDILAEFTDQSGQAGFDQFIEGLLRLGPEVIGPALFEVLQRISEANLGGQGTRNQLRQFLQELVAQILAGGSSLIGGDLNQEQLLEILNTLMGFVNDAEQAGGLGTSETSRSVQIGRSLTEIQANELIALAEDQAFTLRAQLSTLTEIRNLLSSGGASALSNGGKGAAVLFDFTGSTFGGFDEATAREWAKMMGDLLVTKSTNSGKTLNPSGLQ